MAENPLGIGAVIGGKKGWVPTQPRFIGEIA